MRRLFVGRRGPGVDEVCAQNRTADSDLHTLCTTNFPPVELPPAVGALTTRDHKNAANMILFALSKLGSGLFGKKRKVPSVRSCLMEFDAPSKCEQLVGV